ncbi:beta-lactamase family protein [Pendulispora rubella]|uniref:Beta-lactamase family protein n=1 Tax=Pendulispora rubella TaxID=2741070 RepID=A0ABZ2LAT8_9BACT
MRDVMNGYVERGEVPGVVTLVSRAGDVHVEALGTRAMDSHVPVHRDTMFRITSMTKPVTAASTMILVDEGKLRLDDPVDRWLPELANRRVLERIDGPLAETVPAKRAITVRDLLTFRMGFGQLFVPSGAYPIVQAANELAIGMGGPTPGATPEPDEWIRRLGTLPLMRQPGDVWLYNTGSDVLTVLVARVSGRPFDVFLRERIFEPLGMKDTGFSVPAEKIHRLPVQYWTNFELGVVEAFDQAAGGQWSRPPAFPGGGAGLVSTVDDYFAFANMLLHGGVHAGARILSEASVKDMHTDHLTQEQKRASELIPDFFAHQGWGLGMAVITEGDKLKRSPGTFGWDGGFGSSCYIDPTKRLIGILMTQRAWTSPTPPKVCRDFWHSVYAT